jgi:hypothetical protein
VFQAIQTLLFTVYPVFELQIQYSGQEFNEYSAGISTGFVIHPEFVYVVSKSVTLQLPLLHVATCDSHELGHVTEDALYHVTLCQCANSHPHGKGQETGACFEQDAYW